MRQLVINGPKIYPGATIVEYEDGHQIYLVHLAPLAEDYTDRGA
jgi:hypothetical protein